jgi:phosphatidylserine decarboxylase
MLFAQDAIATFADGVEPGETTRMGQPFAKFNQQ